MDKGWLIMHIKTILLTMSSLFIINATNFSSVDINGVNAKVKASSELISKKNPGKYSVKNLFDNDSTTAWVEGVEGVGTDQWVKVSTSDYIKIYGVKVLPGYCKNIKSLTENSIPLELKIKDLKDSLICNATIPYHFNVDHDLLESGASNSSLPSNEQYNFMPAILIFEKPLLTNGIKIVIGKSIAGKKYEDNCISEISLISDPSGIYSFYKFSKNGVDIVDVGKVKTIINGSDPDMLKGLVYNSIQTMSEQNIEKMPFQFNKFYRYLPKQRKSLYLIYEMPADAPIDLQVEYSIQNNLLRVTDILLLQSNTP